MLHCAAVVLAASMVLGQAEGQEQKDDFERLQGFLGTWAGAEMEEDGKTVRWYSSWRPILQGRFIEHRYMRSDGAGSLSGGGMTICGRDPSDGKIRRWQFSARGGTSIAEFVSWEGNKSHWSSEITLPDGTPGTAKMVFELVDEDTFRFAYTLSNGGEGGGESTRIPEDQVTFPKPTLEMREGIGDSLKELTWWTGHSTMEGTDAFTGKLIVGQSTCGWILDGSFLLYDFAGVDSDLNGGSYRALIGVDPLTNQVTGWEFESTGTVGKYVVTDQGQDIVGEAISPDAGLLKFKGRMTKTVDGMEYHATGDLPDDQQTSYHGVWRTRSAETTSPPAAVHEQDVLKEFGEIVVGRWVGQVKLIADMPGLGKQGETTAAHWTFRWIADRKGVEGDWLGGEGYGKSIYMWDAESKTIKQYGVDSGGTTTTWRISKQDNEWVFEGSGCLMDGRKFEGRGMMQITDDGNTMTYTGKFTMDGESLLDLKDVYRRASR